MCTLHINHTQNHFNSNSVLVYHISNNVVSCHRLPLRYIYTNCYVQAPPCGGGPLDNSAQHFHRTNSIFSFSSYLYGIYVVYVFLFISFYFYSHYTKVSSQYVVLFLTKQNLTLCLLSYSHFLSSCWSLHSVVHSRLLLFCAMHE